MATVAPDVKDGATIGAWDAQRGRTRSAADAAPCRSDDEPVAAQNPIDGSMNWLVTMSSGTKPSFGEAPWAS